jgi:formate hydrogenlyase transcriptional activator
MRAVLTKVEQVAGTDSTVLLLGETGVGKERIARAVHAASPRRDRPLIALNCAALPSGLIESELFGHEKGAFTGATERRPGRFALADGGTIFLDEIGDMPVDVQVRLLRVLQEREFEPVGAQRAVKVDVRVIAATHRDLPRAVAAGTFRQDLFYRLHVFPIVVPPLRERAADVPALVHYFAARFARRFGKRIDAVDEATMAMLERYPWPGNIRELQNVVERAVILASGRVLAIDAAMLPAAGGANASELPAVPAVPAVPAAPAAPAAPTLAANERALIESALQATGWRIEGANGAAARLGLHANTLRSRMKKLGLRRPHERS